MSTIAVTTNIPTERVRDLIITAFEGGSNYWYAGLHIVEDVDEVGDPGVHRYHIVPTVPGGKIAFYVDDDEDEENPLTLDLEAIKKGLQIMSQKYPRHFGDFMNENDDAITGDVFLQCCVFGKIIFG